MSELLPPLKESLFVEDTLKLITSPTWIQWFTVIGNVLSGSLLTITKLGSFTRSMTANSGDVSYTGIGFRPSVLIFLSSLSSASLSVGFDDGTLHYYVDVKESTGYAESSTKSIILLQGTGTHQTAIIKTLDSDGFTLTWTKNGTPGAATGTVHYLAFR